MIYYMQSKIITSFREIQKL